MSKFKIKSVQWSNKTWNEIELSKNQIRHREKFFTLSMSKKNQTEIIRLREKIKSLSSDWDKNESTKTKREEFMTN